jgi:hypothetical protein
MKITTEYLKSKGIIHTLSSDGLIIVHGDFHITDDITSLGDVVEIGGSVYVRQGATLDAPVLTSVGGYVDVRQGATLDAPVLTSIGGSVYVRQGATLDAPVLTSIGGYVYVRQGATLDAPVLTSIGGYVDVYEGATLDAPVLTSVEHYRHEATFLGHDVKVFDGIGCVVMSEKTRDDIKIMSCRKASFKDGELIGERMYVVSKGEHNAHGETIEEALSDLAFKSADRDIDTYRNMPADTVKTPHEWAVVYRVVTGACKYGTEQFMKSKGELKDTYTLAEIVAMTQGAYGSDRFREVVSC